MDIVKNLYDQYSNVEIDVAVNVSFFVAIFAIINLCYYPFDWYLSTHFKNYQELEFHRKRYVIKNIFKFFYLSLLTVYGSYYIFYMYILDVWTNSSIYQLGLMYMLPDLISLMRVPKLHQNTIQHHVTVVILAIMNLFVDYTSPTYWRGMIIYSYLSMMTGFVNFYLGYRLLHNDKKMKSNVALCALINYCSCIAINWGYQCYIIGIYIFSDFPIWGLYAYLTLIYFIVKDDIMLISFLTYKSDILDRLKGVSKSSKSNTHLLS